MSARKGVIPKEAHGSVQREVGRHWNHAFCCFPRSRSTGQRTRVFLETNPNPTTFDEISAESAKRVDETACPTGTAVSRRRRRRKTAMGSQTCRRCLVTALSSSGRFCGHCGATLSQKAGVHVRVRRRSGNRVKVAIDRTTKEINMSNTTSATDALRDLFRAHARTHVWLPALLVAVAAGAIALHVRAILHVRPGPGFVPPEFRSAIAYEAVLCWTVSTFCAYVGELRLGSAL